MQKVRDAIRLIERDGWRQVRMRGSHRVYKHPVKPGITVISGHPGVDVPPGMWGSIMEMAGLPLRKPQ